MENYMLSLYKKNLDPSIFKSVKNKISFSNKKIKNKLPNLNFSRKDFIKSLCKHFNLLEKLLIKQITQKMKEHQPIKIDSTDYESVVKKDKTEKKFRKKILKLEQEVTKIRHTKLALDQKLKEQEQEKNEKSKKQELHETMKARAKVRQEEHEKIKKIWSEPAEKQKPRFLIMEESFRLNLEFTEAQRTKSELAKKSLYMKIVEKDELAHHAKYYDRLISEAKKKREAKFAEFSLDNSANSVNIFKRAVSMEREEIINHKKSLVAKRKNYGDIVRELFSPKTMVSEKTEKQSTALSFSLREKLDRIERPFKVISPKKITIKKIENLSPEKKHSKPVNYLKELRAGRGEYFESPSIGKISNSFSFEDISGPKSEVLRRLKKIEKAVHREENRIKLQGGGTALGLEASCKMNDLLVQSVKAKVQMLENSLSS